jgi:hypothetical protein
MASGSLTVVITPQNSYVVSADKSVITHVQPASRFVDSARVAVTASYALTAETQAGVIQSASFASYAVSSSYSDLSLSSSYSITASYADNAGASDWGELTNIPSGLVSSSIQVDYTGLSNVPSGIVSSSQQINTGSFSGSFTGDGSGLTGLVSSSHTLNADNAISSSYTTTASYSETGEWGGLNSIPSGLVSSSEQINTGSFSGSFKGEVSVNDYYSLPTSSGLEHQFLHWTPENTVDWESPHTIYEHFIAGENLTKTDPLYISGSQGALPIVYKADATDPSKMPVVLIANENVSIGVEGRGVALGLIDGIDLTGYPAGTEVFANSGTGWTDVRPTGSSIVQVLGYVTKTGTGGKGLVLNPGPATLPNLTSGSVWVGDSDSVPTATTTSSLSVFSAVSASFATTASYADNAGASDWSELTNIPSGLVSSSTQVDYDLIQNVPSGLVSASSQVDYTGLTNIPSGIVSSSQQINTGSFTGSFIGDGSGLTGLVSASHALNADNAISASYSITASYVSGAASTWDDISGKPSGLVSSSVQINTGSFTGSFIGDGSGLVGIVSASFATTASYVSGASSTWDDISGKPSGLVSSSGQVDHNQTLNYSADEHFTQANITTVGTVTVGNVDAILPSGLVSSSVQINTGSFSGSFTGDGSGLTGLVSASHALNTDNAISSSYAVTASYVSGAASTWDDISGKPSGLVSSSVQVDYTGLSNVPSGIISSSTQFDTLTDPFTGSFTGSFGGDGSELTGVISYNTQSNLFDLSQIKVNDYDNDVAVSFSNGLLTFTFGTPVVPSSLNLSFGTSGDGPFETNRFNNQNDTYDVTGSWDNGGYTIVSASLYTGSTLLAEVGTGTEVTYNTTTSGSQSYTLFYTASSPLDASLYSGSTSLNGTLNKTNPTNPTISPTPTVQLGATSNQIEQGATGSISFTANYGSSNGWDQSSLTTVPAASPLYVTGSNTGSTSLVIQASASYLSPAGENVPQLNVTQSNSITYTKIRSVRYGATGSATFTEQELHNLALWDTTLGGNVGTVDKGNTSPNGDTVTISWSGDQYHYIVYNDSLSYLSNITKDGFGVLGQFQSSSVGNWKVYRTNDLQAGGGGDSNDYVLTI